ncbi:GNAT family N-acetyltransferase [Planktotalea sp.]|uniref:GNAT family N-acetyltransferase n=1 Tax=Planktotalea sp. TaxID=2029877 RepID=UPI0035C869CD
MVAEHDGQIIGYAALQKKMQLQFARRLMDVQHLFVDAHMRGQGVGRALMQNSAEQATHLRCAGVTLGVMADNTSAQAFYKDLGYEMSEEQGALKMVLRLPLQSAACAP